MNFTNSFLITILITSFLFGFSVKDERGWDGDYTAGFPLEYNHISSGYFLEGTPTSKNFNLYYLIIDLIFVFSIPFIVNFLSLKLQKNKEKKKTKIFGIMSLILGILSFPFLIIISFHSILFSFLVILFGVIQIYKNEENSEENILPIIGIILGILFLILILFILIFKN